MLHYGAILLPKIATDTNNTTTHFAKWGKKRPLQFPIKLLLKCKGGDGKFGTIQPTNETYDTGYYYECAIQINRKIYRDVNSDVFNARSHSQLTQ